MCDHLGEEHNDETEEQLEPIQSDGTGLTSEAGGVDQWLYPDPWHRLHQLGFGPYRELLSDYDLIDAKKMRGLGCEGLERQLQQLQLPESDIDRLLAAVFAKKITSATG